MAPCSQTLSYMSVTQLLLTSEYLELQKYSSLTNNQKVFFGPDIPTMFVSNQGDDGAKIAAQATMQSKKS